MLLYKYLLFLVLGSFPINQALFFIIPQLSGFAAAIVHHQHPTHTKSKKPIYAVETSTYLAPEYLMFGKVDVKIDVYSYGVVLLELITGKEATQDLASEHGSLVLQVNTKYFDHLLIRREPQDWINGLP